MSTHFQIKYFLPVVFLFVLIPFISCQVGLGSAVDTEAPTLEITYPPASSVIKGTFTLAGTCDDDKGISSISITVTNTDDKTKAWSYSTGTASGGKTWSISLNQTAETATGFLFPDGKYEIAVAANDNAGHTSGTSSRAFEIDNTAPVFVIKSPAAITPAKASKYGSVFSIDGTIADDHSVKAMTVTVYKDGTAVSSEPYSESDVETAGGTSVTVAKYIAGGADELNTRYTDIYGSDAKAGTKNYSCTVTLTDSAKTYTNQAETSNTTAGNTTSSCWLYDDVYTTLLSTKNGGYGLEASDLKNILNGNLTGTITRSQTVVTSEVLKQLNTLVKDTSTDKEPLCFSLNPDASPRYAVNGYALPDDISKVENGTRGQTITVVATAGLDGTLIVPSTIQVWLHQYDNISAGSTYSAFLNNPGTETGGILLKDNSSDTSSSTATCTLSVQLPNDTTIITGNYYIIAVTGSDADGSKLAADTAYGFIGAVSGTPPTLSVDSPPEQSPWGNSDDLTYSLTAKSTTSTIASVACTVTVTDETNSHTVGTITGSAVHGSGNTWTFSPKDGSGYESCKALAGSGHRYLYTASFTATDENGNSMTSGRSVHIDTLAPVVKITSVTPIVNDSGAQYVNGTITIAGTVNEADLANVTYAVYTAGSSTPAVTGSLGGVYSFSKEIDTTAFTDDADIKIVVSAIDNSGNTGSADTTAYNSGTALVVKQSTDAPKLTPNGFSTDISTQAAIIAQQKNIFNTSGNNTLLGTITDDDGVGSVIITVDGGTPVTKNAGNSKTYALSYTLPAAEGIHTVSIQIQDEPQSATGHNSTLYSFAAAVDKGAPQFAVTTTSGSYYSPSSSISVEGTISDAGTPVIVKVFNSQSDATENGTSVRTVTVSGTSWTDTIPISAINTDGATVYYTATDCYNQTSQAQFVYKVDVTAPTISSAGFASEHVYLDESTYASLSVAAIDPGTSATGIAGVYYQTGDTQPSFTADTGWSPLGYAGGTSYTGNINFSGKSDGTQKVWVAAKDNAGNRTVYASAATITVDKQKPVTTVSGSTTTNAQADVVLTVKVTDTNPGTPVLTVTGPAGGTTSVTAANKTDYSGYTTWTASIPFSSTLSSAADGSYTVSVNETDQNGRAAETASCTILKDTTAPAVTITAPDADTITNGTSRTFTGTAFDTNLSAATIKLYKDGEYNSTIDITNVVEADGSWEWKKYELVSGSTYYITLTAEDKVGNSTTATSKTITVDTTAPVLSNIAADPASGYLKNGDSFAFTTGTGSTVAADTVALDRIEITATKDGSTQTGDSQPSGYWYKKTFTGTVQSVTNTELAVPAFTGAAALNGLWKFNISVYDKAGNSASRAVSFTVDASAPSVSFTKYPEATENSSSPYTFRGTASDTGASGLAKIEYSLDNRSWSTATGDKNWYADVTLAAEGTGTIYVRATDNAGNVSDTASQSYLFDKAAPTLAVTGSSERQAGTVFTLAGTASDSYGIQSVSVTQTKGGTTLTAATTGTGSWNTGSLPLKSAGTAYTGTEISTKVADGTYTYTITATDKAGKTSTQQTVTVVIDSTPPYAPEISAPDSSATGLNALSGTSYIFRGSANDNTGGVGLAKIWYVFSQSTSAPTGTSGYTELDMPDGSWSISRELDTGTASPADGHLCEGTWHLYVKAEDKAGNLTASAAVRTFDIDKSSPSLEETNIGDSSTYNSRALFTLGGTVSDTNSLASLNVTQTKGSQSYAVTPSAVSGSWTTISLPLKADNTSVGSAEADSYNGIYVYVITATDSCGKTTTLSRTVCFDTVGPEIVVTSPDADEQFRTGSVTVKGTVTDATTSTAALYYSTASTAPSVPAEGSPALLATNWTGWETLPVSTNWSKILTPLADATHTVSLCGVDTLGNVSAVQSRTFYVDATAPSLTITTPATKYTKNNFTLSGTASDAVNLAYVQITAGSTPVAEIPGSTITAASNTWSQEIASTYLTGNADTLITVTAADAAGNTFAQTYSVFRDTSAPEVVLKNLADGQVITESDLTSGIFTAKGTWSDNGGSGVAKLEYKIGSGSWTTFASGSGKPAASWTEQLTLSQTLNTTISFRTTDAAGNMSADTAYEFTGINVDTAAPLTGTSLPAEGSTTYCKLNDVLTVSGTASDTLALARVEIIATKNGTRVASDGTAQTNGIWYLQSASGDSTITLAWNKILTCTSATEGTWVFTVTAYDKAGRTSVSDTRTCILDATPPSFAAGSDKPHVTTTSYTDRSGSTWYGSGSLSVTGKITENTGIKSVEWRLDTTDWATFDAVSTVPGTYTFSGTVPVTANWNSQTIYMRATDTAGNLTSYTDFTGINVDLENPSFTITAPATTPLLNGQSALPVTASVSDGQSGVASMKLKIGSNSFDSPDASTTTITSGSMTAALTAAEIASAAGTQPTVYVQVSDYTGKSTVSSFTFQKDTTPPTVAFSDSLASTLNKTVTISGTAGDTQGLSAVTLYYNNTSETAPAAPASKPADGDATWTKLSAIDSADIYNWSTSIDTTLYDGTDGTGPLHLLAFAEDKAGNIKATVKSFTIDQDTDRPIINLTNLSLAGMSASQVIWLRNANIVYGTVTDDDGIENGSASLFYNTDGGTAWTAITVTNGSWNLTLTDGEKTLYFKVIDKASTSFVSAASGTASPKLSDGTNTFAGYTILHLNVDKTPPAYANIKYKVYDTGSGTWSDWLADYASEKFGGKHSKFRLQLTATDNNGIASIATTFNGATDTQAAATSGDTWETGEIDASSGNGSLKVKLVITDGAGLTSEPEFNIAVDNTVPVITIVTPSAQISSAETIHGSISETSTVYYAVSRTDTTVPGTTAVANQSTAWAPITDATLSWNVYFDGSTSEIQTHTDLFRYYISTLGIATADDITNNVYKDLTTLYVWIKAVDESGNVSTKSQQVTIDPQGDRPVVTLSYPESDNETLGGSVRMIGTATDNVAAKYVWVQIDTDGDGDFDGTDQSTLTTDGYTVGDMTQNSATPNSDVSKNGIMVTVSGSSWNLTINGHGEFNPTGSETTKKLILRIYATDADKNLSAAVARTVYIDKDTPVIVQDSLKLVQYETSSGSGIACTDGTVSTGTPAASQSYTDGMSIRGIWFLTGSITDDSGIKKITKNSVDVITTVGQETAEFIKGEKSSTTEAYDYTMNIPVGSTTDAVGTTSITITATENTDNNLYVTKTFSVIYDNKAPEITTSGAGFNISSTIVNSNGFYTFGSVAAENAVGGTNQTGVERIAFYFTRDIDSPSTHNLYDVLIANGSGGNTISSYSSLQPSDGLYWKSAAVSSVTGATITLSASDDNIHAGGLAKVNGVIYRISSVSGTAVTLSGEPDSSTTSALFAVASVVDNTTAEGTGTTKNDAGYYTNGAYDDGDLMMESVIKQGTSYTWEANINSKNIPDGKVVLHYVVFDKAGNYVTGTVNAFVKNNQPRIAGMKIGTDDNGNSTIDSSEYITTMSSIYAKGLNSAGNKVTDVTFPNQESGLTSAITAKGLTVIKPEIVGGNGTLGYTYSVAQNSGAETWGTPYYTKTSVTELGTGGESSDSVVTLTNDITFTVQDFLSAGTTGSEIADGSNQKFSFSIWDSTPGTTLGTDSQYATMNVIMNVALRDTTPATDYIKPFYWNSSSDNSLFAESKGNGHIELPADLPADTFKTTNSGEYDLQPKVSGQIKIEGIAHDNALLSSLTAAIAGFNSGSSFTIATYNTGSGGWTPESSLSDGAIPAAGWACETAQATYAEYVKAGYGSLPDGYTGTEKVPYTSQTTGHTVHWILYFDTSKITNAADTDKLISVTALDRGKPTLSGGTVSYTPNAFSAATGQTGGTDGSGSYTSRYTVDVVPYIIKISTPVRTSSGLKDNNIRAASGKYSVIADSTSNFITVTGFNLNPGTNDVRIITKAQVTGTVTNGTSGTGTAMTISTSASSPYTSFSLSNTAAKSGYLEVFTNNIRALNNINKNNAAGSYTTTDTTDAKYANYYNREPDYYTTKNTQLTDDRYLRFFSMKSTGIKNGYYPTMIMEGDNPVFGYLDLNGGPSTAVGTGPGTGAGTYQAANAALQRAEFNGSTGAEIYTEYLVKQLATDQQVMAVDESGRYLQATVNNYSGETMALYYDRYNELNPNSNGDCWGGQVAYTDYTGRKSYQNANNALGLDSIAYSSSLLGRYQYPKLLFNGDSKTGTGYVYMSYFDALTGEILFRDFQLGKTVNGTATALNSSGSDSTGTTYSQYVNFTENTSNSNTWHTGRLSGATSASKYFAMGITSDNHVVLVYYSESDSKLHMQYSTAEVTGASPTTSVAWTVSSVSFPEYVGSYVSMFIDSSNRIHIAAFDSSDSNLIYMFLPSYDSTTMKTVTVDQASAVGNWTQIKVSGTTPYIAYYNATETGSRDSIKLAYLNTPISSSSDIVPGVDSNSYTTGAWEYMTVPTITPPQGGSTMFQNVCLDFDSSGIPVVGYLGTNIEFGKWLTE